MATFSTLTADTTYMRGANKDVFNSVLIGNLTNNDETVTVPSTATLQTTLGVTGHGVPASTTISSITNTTTFEMSKKATKTMTTPLSFTTVTDAELSELFYYESKLDLEYDIRAALNLDPEDTTTLDDVTDLNETFLGMALANRQLMYYYLQNNDGDGSASYDRMRYYTKQYSDMKANFSKLLERSNGIPFATNNRVSFG